MMPLPKSRSTSFSHNLTASLKACTFFLCLCLLLHQISFGQDKCGAEFGKVSVADFDISKYQVKDSNAHAIIIADVGLSSFIGNKRDWFDRVFKRYTRIKILDKEGFNIGAQEIVLYIQKEQKEQLTAFSAITYNLEGGSIQQLALEKKDVFEEKLDKNHLAEKFALPGIKEGSIVEIQYTISSPFDFNLPSWNFQDVNYPCVWSEYQASIPNLLIYSAFRQGNDSFYINKRSQGRAQYTITQQPADAYYGSAPQEINLGANTNNIRWVMRNLPALRTENYMSTPANYVDRIEFQLTQVSNGETTTDVMTDWKKASAELSQDDDFGAPLVAGSSDLRATIDKDIKGSNNVLQTAKNVFYYIQSNFVCTGINNIWAEKHLANTYAEKKGTVGEINLLLVLALRTKGIFADPVLLSTKENGYAGAKYPVLDKLNYVICRAKVDGRDYYLDATRSFLSFGNLPDYCYNGTGHVINPAFDEAVVLSADSVKEQSLILVTISNSTLGQQEGTVVFNPGRFESYNIRKTLSSIAPAAYTVKLGGLMSQSVIDPNYVVDSIKNLDQPLKLTCDFKYPSDSLQSPNIYFSPFLSGAYQKNPFTALTRAYPVEMPYCTDKTYILNMQVPQGYKVDGLPKSARVKLNENDGLFEYIISATDTRLQLRCRLLLNKANFDAADYQTLRDFFAFVVKKEAEQITFKKIE